MAIQQMQELFLRQLADIYDAEHRFVQGQEDMLAQADAQQLREALEEHIKETRGHIRNLDKVFQILGMQPERRTSNLAVALVNQAQTDMAEAGSASLRDILIDGAASKVEQFEIASYNMLVEGARLMGQQGIVELLDQNLEQEANTVAILLQAAPMLISAEMQRVGAQPVMSGTATTVSPTRLDAGETMLATQPEVPVHQPVAGEQRIIVDGQPARVERVGTPIDATPAAETTPASAAAPTAEERVAAPRNTAADDTMDDTVMVDGRPAPREEEVALEATPDIAAAEPMRDEPQQQP